MFAGSRLLATLPISFAALLSSCGDFDEPQPLNPQKFFGCYAESEFRITIGQNGVLIDGQRYPVEIHEEKIGLVIVLPLIFVNDGDGIKPRNASEHFYRLIDDDNDRYIIVADQDAFVHELEYGACG
ncbi:hypothetical protein [Sphingorhabdus sp. 109]|jgi:hypothetical protein|uniref:hypothetical protein n=1 Tax=Sphingorhabdus sp. 109 TaxID=2653173 RepID=UPI0012F1E1A8|nr:hypothetical protein [Sphingorhabdus sp. 109]VWX60727.1 putative tRNA-dihydrouridine synthase A [Sphingorhabdus sp. 109]